MPTQLKNVPIARLSVSSSSHGFISNMTALLESVQLTMCTGELVIQAKQLDRLVSTLQGGRTVQPHDWQLTADPQTSVA